MTSKYVTADQFFFIHDGLVDTDKNWYVSYKNTAPEWARELVRYCQAFDSEDAACTWLRAKLETREPHRVSA